MKRLSIIALLITLATGVTACGGPVIQDIVPEHAAPGAVIELQGENFGGSQGKGYVEIGATAVASDHILSWSNTAVKMRLPATAPVGATKIQLTTDGDTPSNKKDFTVDPTPSATGQTVVVANRSVPSLEVFNLAPDAKRTFQLNLRSEGSTTTLRGLAASATQQKIFVSAVRRDAAGEETSSLVVFGGSEGGITAPTLVDVGVQPTGLAVSPTGNRVYVAATASGMLTVVNAVDNSIIADLAVDLAGLSYGFEPLYVTAFASPDTTDTGDWVAVAGNNWFLGRTEIVTYAPNTTQPIVSVIALDGLTLQAPIAVSAATAQAWVAGDQGGTIAIAALDLGHGVVLDVAGFGAGLSLSGFAGMVSTATDVVADAAGLKVYVALPEAGVAAIPMAADGKLSDASLIAVEGPYRLLPVAVDAAPADVYVTRPAAGAIARIGADGSVTPEFLKTLAEPSEIVEFPMLAQ